MVQEMGRAALGTFHKRQGDQHLLRGVDPTRSGWMRVFGEAHDQKWTSSITSLNYQLAPDFDGRVWGFQTGLDLMGAELAGGIEDRFGIFYAHSAATGDVSGNVLAQTGIGTGRLNLHGDGLGAYWTRIGPGGWYLDAVVLHNWLGGHATSDRGIGAKTDGTALLASLESGFPIVLGRWTLEPQAQLIWQRVDLDDTSDRFSFIGYDTFDAFTGRLGLRLESNADISGIPLQTFVSADLWHDFSRTEDVVFNLRSATTKIGGTSLELRGGVSAQLTAQLGAYVSASYTTSVDAGDRQSIGGNLGFRFRW